MSTYEWVTLGFSIVGFVGTWIIGAFKLGRAVEQMRAGVKEDVDDEREKIIAKICELEQKFDEEQQSQDRIFGEVGAAMRQYTADVEKKLREVEIYGRDNYVKIPDFEKAIDRLGETMKAAVVDLKEDMRRLLKPSH